MSNIAKGTLVYVSDSSVEDAIAFGKKRIFVGYMVNDCYECVSEADTERFLQGGKSYGTVVWGFVVPVAASEPVQEDTIKPNHYGFRGGVRTIDFLTQWDFSGLTWNVCKYVYRYPQKGGLEALRKVERYLLKRLEIHPKAQVEQFVAIEPVKFVAICAYCSSNGFSPAESAVITYACLKEYDKALEALRVLMGSLDG